MFDRGAADQGFFTWANSVVVLVVVTVDPRTTVVLTTFFTTNPGTRLDS
jgi:hypothetical protein